MVDCNEAGTRPALRISLRFVGVLLGIAGLALALSSPADAQDGDAVVDLEGCGANTLPANDDGSTDAVSLGFQVNFFGQVFDSVFVNNNGNVTFDEPLAEFTPFDLTTTDRVIIAPFFADVDTRGASSGEVTYGQVTHDGRQAFCVNWPDVGYFDARDDKLNDFQLLLVDRSTEDESAFDIIFNYDQIQWETGEASDGTDGLGGNSARVGYSSGGAEPQSLELAGSGENGAFLDDNPDTGLIHNSRTNALNPVLGRYLFKVRGGEPPPGGGVFGNVSDGDGNGLPGATVQACSPERCRAASTSASGGYSISGLEPGAYELRGFPPSGRLGLLTTRSGPVTVAGEPVEHDITLEGLQPLPEGASLEPSNPGDSGIPVVYWGDDLDLTVPGCEGGTGTFTVTVGGEVVAEGSLTETSPGIYTGTIPALSPDHGNGQITFTISDCPDPADDTTSDFNIYIDPSGFVRTVEGEPIAGATVTLFRSEDEDPDTGDAGPYTQVPDGSAIMDPSNRTNPDQTNDEGHFGWDVITGWYLVRAQAEHCVDPDDPSEASIETDPMFIPPEVTDLDMRLQCSGVDGTVTDADTGEALEDATVTVAGPEEADLTTGAEGGYLLTPLTPGDYTLTADADGYAADSQTATVEAGVTTTTDFALTPEVACPEGEVPAAAFTDRDVIPEAHRSNVDCASWRDIVSGFEDGTYGPALPVRRDQMATFIAGMLEAGGVDLPEPREQRFGDVDAGNVHDDAVHRLAAAEIVLGGPEGLDDDDYGPGLRIRRDQMASFLLRAAEFATGDDLASQQQAFDDVPQGNVHFANVNGAAEADFARGFGDGTYGPATDVRRDQMASFVIRVLDHLFEEG